MRSKNAKLKIGSVAFVFGWLSNCLSFFVASSTLALHADPNGEGSGYALAFFLSIAPVVAIIGGMIAAIVILYRFSRFSETNPELPRQYDSVFVVILISIFMGLAMGIVGMLVLYVLAN